MTTCGSATELTQECLSDLCTLITDGTHKTPKYTENGIPFISTANIVPFGAFKFGTYTRYISEKDHIELTRRCKPEPGDILVSKIGTLGLSKLVDVDYPFSIFVGLALLKLKRSAVDGRFLEQVLNTQECQQAMVAASPGSTRSTLTLAAIKKLEICLPPIAHQRGIAKVLSMVDQAIEQTDALIAKQERIKTGLMQDLLTRGIDEHGNLRSEQSHAFKDSRLGRIPVEWEVKRLGCALEKINQGWSPDCDSDPADMGEWGVLKTTAVVWQGYQAHENKALPSTLKPRPSLEIRPGDLLMTRAGPNSRVGVVVYVYGTRSKLMLSDKIYRLVPAKNIDGRFLCYSLSGFQSQRHLSNLKTGMAESQTNISQDIVKALLTVCPPEKEQEQIADRIDRLSGESNKTVATLKKLRSLKTGLMQGLLTGKKRVTPLLGVCSQPIEQAS
jgi:type I restriction enzyme, S subunit